MQRFRNTTMAEDDIIVKVAPVLRRCPALLLTGHIHSQFTLLLS